MVRMSLQLLVPFEKWSPPPLSVTGAQRTRNFGSSRISNPNFEKDKPFIIPLERYKTNLSEEFLRVLLTKLEGASLGLACFSFVCFVQKDELKCVVRKCILFLQRQFFTWSTRLR